jgi:hypothetical protein
MKTNSKPPKQLLCYLGLVLLTLLIVFIVMFANSQDSSGSARVAKEDFYQSSVCFECLKRNFYISSSDAEEKLFQGIYPFYYWCT